VRVAGREGATLGPYRLTRLLGAGGAGEVYLAEGPVQGGTPGVAAVKVLRGGAGDATTREVARQAHAVAGLHQSHVLPIYRVGEDRDAVYVAMAYAPGGSLSTSVRPDGAGQLQLPLAPGVVARLITQTARALQAVHARGQVHGDLKLSNVFVRTAPQGGPMVAVGDFGQSVVVEAAAAGASTAGAENGWPASALLCAAPEQLAGRHLPASDQYALATIAYLLLTGHYPFSGDARSLRMRLLREPPRPPSQLDPTLSPQTDAVLLRGLAKAPEARFPDVTVFAQALSDSLTAGVAATDVTQQFAYLAAGEKASGGTLGRASAIRPPASAGASATGVRRPQGQASGASSGPGASSSRIGAPPAGAPLGPGAGARRPLTQQQRIVAAVAAVVVLGLLLAGGLGLHALATASGVRPPLPNFGGLDYAPTATPDAAQAAQQRKAAQAAEQQLTAATSASPVFSDALANNSHGWPVDGKQSFFGTDGRLHVYNQKPQEVISIDQPGSVPLNFAVTADLTFLRGSISDMAGLRVRVTPTGGGSVAHFTVLISPEGRYEVWRFDGSRWISLDNGYTQAIKRGLDQANQLAVLMRGASMWVFVDGHFVTAVRYGSAPSDAGAVGPTVIYSGTEVAFAHYAVYRVN
jgi:hypothetical protein